MLELFVFLEIFVTLSFSQTSSLYFERYLTDTCGHCLKIKETSLEKYSMIGNTCIFGAGNTDFYIGSIVNEEVDFMKVIGGSEHDYARTGIILDEGSYIVAGDTSSLSIHSGNNLFFSKFSQTGTKLWLKSYGVPDVYSDAGSIKETDAGEFIFVGEIDGDLLLTKLSSSGSIVWSQTYTSTSCSNGMAAEDVIQTKDLGFVVVGKCGYPTSKTDSYISKFASNGDFVWSSVIDSSDGWSNRVVQLDDESYIVAGTTRGYSGTDNMFQPMVAKFSKTGSLEWLKNFVNFGIIIDMFLLSSGTIAFIGKTYSNSFVGLIAEDGSLNTSYYYDKNIGYTNSGTSISTDISGGFITCGKREDDSYFAKLGSDLKSCNHLDFSEPFTIRAASASSNTVTNQTVSLNEYTWNPIIQDWQPTEGYYCFTPKSNGADISHVFSLVLLVFVVLTMLR